MLAYLLSLTDESNHKKVEYLYHEYHDDMLRYAKYKLRQTGLPNYETDAEDVVQNAFIKIIKYIKAIDFESGYNSIKAYVLSIVANEVINQTNNYKKFDSIDDHLDELSDDDFIEQLEIRERYETVVNAIKKLDEKYCTVLLFRFYNNMSVKEIASLMGISEKTVYTRLERGKRILLKLINEVCYE